MIWDDIRDWAEACHDEVGAEIQRLARAADAGQRIDLAEFGELCAMHRALYHVRSIAKAAIAQHKERRDHT